MRARRRARRRRAARVADLPQRLLGGRGEEAAAVVEHVEVAVRAELHAHGLRGRLADDARDVDGRLRRLVVVDRVRVEADRARRRRRGCCRRRTTSGPRTPGTSSVLGAVLVVAVERTRHRRLAAAGRRGTAACRSASRRSSGAGRRRSIGNTGPPPPPAYHMFVGVAGGRFVRPVFHFDSFLGASQSYQPVGIAGVVAVAIGLVVARAVRPAIVAGLRDRGQVLVARRAEVGARVRRRRGRPSPSSASRSACRSTCASGCGRP